jgi:hypothetical protein
MDITGCDLVVFTFTPPRDVYARVFASVLGRWPGALMDDTDGPPRGKPVAGLPREQFPDGEAFVIFYRDAAMVRHMEEAAYIPMPDGDGPFAVITRFRRDVEFAISGLDEKHAADHTPGGVRPPDPYPAWLCSPTLIEVTAVTPGDPDVLPFAAWVLNEVKRACRGAA